MKKIGRPRGSRGMSRSISSNPARWDKFLEYCHRHNTTASAEIDKYISSVLSSTGTARVGAS